MNYEYDINPAPRRDITVAELAEALANGQIRATRNDEYYDISVRDLIQLTRSIQQPMPQPQYRFAEQQRELALAS